MVKEFNSLEKIEKYYDAESNTYVFKEDNEMIDLVVFNFDLNIGANIIARDIRALNIISFDITAWNIRAMDIEAKDITADDINAWDIIAKNISYYAVCFAYYNIKCISIKGRRENAKHFVLDGKLEVEENG